MMESVLELEPIAPYTGFETPRTIEVPKQLPDARGTLQSTTFDSTRPKGRLIHSFVQTRLVKPVELNIFVGEGK